MGLPARFFYPRPKVSSAFIKLEKNEKADVKDLRLYKKFLTKVFSFKRKMLKQKLDTEIIKKAGINEEIIEADLDLKSAKEVRKIWPFFRDRRIELYECISKRYC